MTLTLIANQDGRTDAQRQSALIGLANTNEQAQGFTRFLTNEL